MCTFFFFFNDTATTEIYTLSLHDALPISNRAKARRTRVQRRSPTSAPPAQSRSQAVLSSVIRSISDVPSHQRSRSARSEEHTSELQSRQYLVCRLLLEKKNINANLGPVLL